MFHTVAFSQNNTSSNVGTLTTPVVDPTVTINGNNLLIPDKMNQLFGVQAFNTTSSIGTLTQVQTPSLREVFFPTVQPGVVGDTTGQLPFVTQFFDNPIPLLTAEGLNIQTNATGSGNTGQQGAVVWLADGKRTPATGGKIYTIRATAAIQQAVNVWTNGTLTFGQSLPVGNYDVVGMRVEASSGVAARLVFVGPSSIVRPGTLIQSGPTIQDLIDFRYGRLGVWGTFYSVTPPSLEVLGGVAATQTVYLDLVPR